MGCVESFDKHIDIWKGFFCEVKSTNMGDGTKHFMPLLDRWELDLKEGMFKMKSTVIARQQCCHLLM